MDEVARTNCWRQLCRPTAFGNERLFLHFSISVKHHDSSLQEITRRQAMGSFDRAVQVLDISCTLILCCWLVTHRLQLMRILFWFLGKRTTKSTSSTHIRSFKFVFKPASARWRPPIVTPKVCIQFQRPFGYTFLFLSSILFWHFYWTWVVVTFRRRQTQLGLSRVHGSAEYIG